MYVAKQAGRGQSRDGRPSGRTGHESSSGDGIPPHLGARSGRSRQRRPDHPGERFLDRRPWRARHRRGRSRRHRRSRPGPCPPRPSRVVVEAVEALEDPDPKRTPSWSGSARAGTQAPGDDRARSTAPLASELVEVGTDARPDESSSGAAVRRAPARRPRPSPPVSRRYSSASDGLAVVEVLVGQRLGDAGFVGQALHRSSRRRPRRRRAAAATSSSCSRRSSARMRRRTADARRRRRRRRQTPDQLSVVVLVEAAGGRPRRCRARRRSARTCRSGPSCPRGAGSRWRTGRARGRRSATISATSSPGNGVNRTWRRMYSDGLSDSSPSIGSVRAKLLAA